MLITIDTNGTPASAAGMQAIATAEPAMPAGDAGGGPLGDDAQFDPQATPSSAVDAGGPPAWLTASVAAAESTATMRYGFAPAPAPRAEAASTTVEDAGSGPTDDPIQ